jgi:hypothetical protein
MSSMPPTMDAAVSFENYLFGKKLLWQRSY